ncbi:MAG: response regulator transcription factor [Fluviicola sp.]|nr:response regulator transcription factor [Fluviicola sp.]
MEKIRILLADDHQLIINGISQILKSEPLFDLIATANNGEDALAIIEDKQPDIALLDIEMPKLSGIEVVEKKNSPTKIIFLSAYEEQSMIRRCLDLGAKGYLLKKSNPAEIIEAIKRVHQDGTYFSQEVTGIFMNRTNEPKKEEVKSTLISALTKRELEILQLIVDGNSNPKIAEQLFISKRTVDTHRVNLMRKLDIHSTVSLVKFALDNNL